MNDKDLHQRILGILKPWSVSDVDLQLDTGKIEVRVSTPSSADLHYPAYQSVYPRHDKRERRWRRLDTCHYQPVFVSQLLRVKCDEHGIKQTELPWAEQHSQFIALFEILAIDWLKEALVSAVARQLDILLDSVDGIMQRVAVRGLKHRDDAGLYLDLDVEESAFRKHHDYVTVIYDPGTGAVVHLWGDQKKQSLKDSYKSLSEDQRTGIRNIWMNIWSAFINATLESLPVADNKICFDRFHVVQHLGKAVDKVRRNEHKKLKSDVNAVLARPKHDWLLAEQNVLEKRLDAFRRLCNGACLGVERGSGLSMAVPISHMSNQDLELLTCRSIKKPPGAREKGYPNNQEASIGNRQCNRYWHNQRQCREYQQSHQNG